MGILSEKITQTVEYWTGLWKDRLLGWISDVMLSGVKHTFDGFEPEYLEYLKPTLEGLRDNPETPPELKSIINKMLGQASWVQIPMAVWMLISMFGGIAISQMVPSFKKIGYFASARAEDYRFDPAAMMIAWRRFPEWYEKFPDDLREQGFSEERIDALKDFTLFYPSPGDLVRWQAREVFEPEMVSRYGLDDELEAIDKEPFYKAGMTDEQIRNFWRAHWEHASWIQVVEMLRRGQLTEEEVWDWFRVFEIPPFWRDKLIAISRAVPTRVDVRRFWDMRTIDEARLREIYTWQGYHGKDLDDYVLWTKVYCAFPDLIARWSKGWIKLDQVKSELVALGMPAARVEEMIETKVKAEEPGRVAGEKDLTKSDIIKGVKTGVITWDEGVEFLMELDWDEEEADYILEVNVGAPEDVEEMVKTRDLTKADILNAMKKEVITIPQARDMLVDQDWTPQQADILILVKLGVSSFEDLPTVLVGTSPRDYAGFKALTQRYRRAIGMEGKPVPEELKKAADELVMTSKEVETLKASLKEAEAKLIEEEVLPEAATKERDELRVALHRAEAELARVQTDYDAILARYKHGG